MFESSIHKQADVKFTGAKIVISKFEVLNPTFRIVAKFFVSIIVLFIF